MWEHLKKNHVNKQKSGRKDTWKTYWNSLHTEIVYLQNFPTVSILFGKTSPKSGGMCDNCLLTPMFRSLMIPGRDRFDCIWMWI